MSDKIRRFSSRPIAYRLVQNVWRELSLQGEFEFTQMGEFGVETGSEWQDIPTIDIRSINDVGVA